MSVSTRRDGPTGHEPRAVQKALALLEAVARLGPGATAKQIAAQTGTPPATAYRLLNLLVADGYLVRIEDLSGFALGRRTRELAGAAAPEPDHVLAELRDQLRFGIHLASFAGSRIRIVDKDPDHELGGEKVLVSHPHASAIGKLLMADHPELVAAPLRRVTTFTITSPVALAEELRRVSRAAVATEVNECRLGRSAIAVPVRAAGGAVVGALAAIGRTGRLAVDDRELIELLTASARRLRR
ncbi:IclR family transcriptional regulator [Nocardia mangyaensis]|uniref:IclR family transcriptional regulator n=1 Tax=Nocardia mangyaensis TaxID=2213200 RepID=A0A1J0VWB5_9NOCA|nr:helix-turn-helix domain-containing protein [Nocardia mangyaensis]APE36298.1 IclR family transcriptional regulator [Nocardia mangyaensis]